MSRKVFLPRGQALADELAPPTVDAIRKRLGGRMTDPNGPFRGGAVVDVETASGGKRTGVVLCCGDATVDVLLDRGIVKRTAPSRVVPHPGATPEDLAGVAAQASVFASLTEGQPVHVERTRGETSRGVLREKCRYGALVEDEGGAMLGVGFQRIWPAPLSSAETA